MPHLIAALFEDHGQAGKALTALLGLGITAERIVALGRNEAQEISSISGFRSLVPNDGFAAAFARLDLPPEDRRTFWQGLQSGYNLIAVQVDAADLDKAIQAIEVFDPVDIDRESRNWSKAGTPTEDFGGFGPPIASREGLSNTEDLPGMGNLAERQDTVGTEEQQEVNLVSPTEQIGTGARPAKRDLNRTGRVWAYGVE